VGRAAVPADGADPGGEAFRTGRPVVVPDLREAGGGTDLPDLYPQHGIVASANVPIAGGDGERPFGVLEVDAREPRDFEPHDIDFLRRFAEVMGNALRALRRNAAAQAESEAKSALLHEQQHRVRNNLMAVTAMLRGGERAAADEGSRARFGDVRRRVFAMASLYDHLLGAGLSGNETCLRDYLAALCAGAREFHDFPARGIALAFEAGDEALPMGIDACTVLGVVVNELVANAAEHAFGPAGRGRIAVRLVGGGGRGGRAVEVEDDGVGVPPGAEGRSVGLGVARRLVEGMGASLALRSGPGRTVWTIALPGDARA
jgi:two-component sensor histidine kinase